MRDLILRMYDRAIDVIVIGLVLIMIVVMGFAFVDVVMNVWHLIPNIKSNAVNAEDFRNLIVTVLDVFVLIELFDTFTSYVKTRHVRLTQLLDVTVVFALRELLVKLYANSFAATELIGLCAIIILLVLARSLTSRMSPHAGR
ncbi:MAG: phosphate-starvation-inducible PsiE family protein [Steroidobacteraceae bacterium]